MKLAGWWEDTALTVLSSASVAILSYGLPFTQLLASHLNYPSMSFFLAFVL